MASISVSSITKSFGGTKVLDSVSLSVNDGEFFFLLGPSGCGKSTLLRIIAGLEQPDAGDILLRDSSIAHLPAYQRGIGMVFQQYALWPHMTTFENIAFGLRLRGKSQAEVGCRVNEVLTQVRLEGFGERYPHELSGGQQQRVALARAIAPKPEVLLLDEPLSNLDARLRDNIRRELSEIHRELGITMIYVTHDQEDALTLATRVAIMQSGSVVQVAPPLDLYRSPCDTFVSTFMGESNLFRVEISSHERGVREVQFCGRSMPVVRCSPLVPSAAKSGVYAVRPEDVSVEAPGTCTRPGEKISISGTVTSVVQKGDSSDVEVRVVPALGKHSDGHVIRAKVFGTRRNEIEVGENVACEWFSLSGLLLPVVEG